MSNVLIVDGNSIINRAYYGVRPMATQSGIYTNAILGTVNILTRHLGAVEPSYAAVAFDMRAPTFRHELYEGYKSSRKGMPEELAMQLPYVKQICELLGFCVLTCEGYEADDILGTVCAMGAETGAHCCIVTGDRDSLQLVSGSATVLLATTGEDLHFDLAAVAEKYELAPSQLIDLKALMGDKSDEIPGVRGIGEVTALKLMREIGSLDRIYAALEGGELKCSESIKKKLANDREMAYLSQKLARINCAVPLGLGIEDLRLREQNIPELLEVYTSLELRSLIKKLGVEGGFPSPAKVSPAKASPIAQEEGGQLSFDMEEESPEEVIPSLSLELLTVGETVYACADALNGAVYVCQDGSVYRAEVSDKAVLAGVFGGAYEICTDDAKRLYGMLYKAGGEPSVGACKFDLSLAAYVLSPTDGGYSTEKLAMRYLSRSVFENRSGNVALQAELADELKKRLAENGQESLFYSIELPLVFVLLDMEREGFLVDRFGIGEYAEKLAEQMNSLQEQIYELAGYVFNINSPKQLGEVLFEKLGLPSGRKNKSGYSTDAEVLEKLAPYHPIVRGILEFRAVSKLKSTYCDGLIKCISSEDGRIHTSFNQTITATGRLSSTEPNLQNIPVRTEAGHQLRKYFIAREGCVLLDADYSQIELRLLAHISGDEELIRAFNNDEDIHALTASQVFGVDIDEVTSTQRKRAKAVNFGIVYGIGDFSLAQDIGVTRAEAAEYIRGYFAKYPGVKRYMDEIAASARELGYVETFMGRRRYIPELVAAKKQLISFGERVARNTPIQGGAADIIKSAMINCHKRLRDGRYKSKLILQVHDELIIEAPLDEADEVSAILNEEMENTCELAVRLVAEVSRGRSWYDAKS